MNAPESPRGGAPVFVDASGRRRRGLTVLGYLGASACTAYLVAVGVTVSTSSGAVDVASGVALRPSPEVPDDGDDDADLDEVPAAVVTPPAARSETVVHRETTSVRHAAHSPRHEGRTGRHRAAEPPRATVVHRAVTPPRVTVRVVHHATAQTGRHCAPDTTPGHHETTTVGTTTPTDPLLSDVLTPALSDVLEV